MNIDIVKESIRNISDFPKQGVQFKDVFSALKRADIFDFVVNEICNYYEEKGITKIVGVESRGFILGSAIAYRLGGGFIPVRKPGKLPADVFSQVYELEYGSDVLEIHKDALLADDVVLIHDDLLATGGTIQATVELVKRFNCKGVFVNSFVELGFLKGRLNIDENIPLWSMIQF